MSHSDQTPRNGLAKLLWDSNPEDSPQDIADRIIHFECPSCGWKADLRRNGCMVCEYNHQLEPVEGPKNG